MQFVLGGIVISMGWLPRWMLPGGGGGVHMNKPPFGNFLGAVTWYCCPSAGFCHMNCCPALTPVGILTCTGLGAAQEEEVQHEREGRDKRAWARVT